MEIDAPTTLMLGLSAHHLALMFRAQFPVLRSEAEMRVVYGEFAGRLGR